MVVLPGTFFLEMASALHRELFNDAGARFEDIQFLSPVILAGEDVALAVYITELGGWVEYRFAEKSQRKSNDSASSQITATLRIATSNSHLCADVDLSPPTFQAQAESLISAAEFYDSLRRNRNQ